MAENGIEVRIPGIATLKNLKEHHLNSLYSFVTAVAVSLGAFFLWQHDSQAAAERLQIATKIEQGNKALKESLDRQAEQTKLQTCIMFLALTSEQQQRIKIANPKVCSE